MRRTLFNQKSKKSLRVNLRSRSTKAETILWYKIRNNQLGYKFRRQHGIGKYIVDFYCPELKLIVEIDGGIHFEEINIIADKEREAYLKKLGFKIIRYNNLDVIRNTDDTINDLSQVLSRQQQPHPNPPL